MKIIFDAPVVVHTIPQQVMTVTEITIDQTIDYPEQKKVLCISHDLPNVITLWEGEAYDNIGQWTDQDVINRINEIYS